MEATSPLTIDAALALLDGYESEHQLVSMAVMSRLATDESAAARTQTKAPAEASDRFQRARARKKHELSLLRLQARGLEETVQRLRQRRLEATGSEQLVWRHAAMRQQNERQEAEQLNAQLRHMVEATLKQTRRLRAMMLHLPPDGLAPLVHHKRLRPARETTGVASAVELHGLLITVDLLELLVDETFASFGGGAREPATRAAGCGLAVHAVDTRAVPCAMATASDSVWRLLAFENAPTNSDDASTDTTSTTVTRTYGMDVVSGSFRVFYRGSAIYRKRVLDDGRVVVFWASEWEPVGLSDWDDVFHESFRRQGFVCLSPSLSDPTRFTTVQSLYRIERDACGDASCTRGACGDQTVAKAEASIHECVQSEIQRMVQRIENEGMTTAWHSNAMASERVRETSVRV